MFIGVGAPTSSDVYGLEFPSNGDSPASTLVVFRFQGANLLPAWPATYVWRVRPVQQTGYYTTFFWGTQNTGSFSSADGYYGAHPYPPGGSSGTTHNWEVSTEGADYTTDDNGNNTTVVKDQWYTQALIVRLVNTDELELKFYWDLETSANRVITYTSTSNWTNTFDPPNPGLNFGDAMWAAGTERLSGILGPVKIFSTNLTAGDAQSEAADMTQIVTSAGTSNRWWFKPTFDSVDDLTDSVTGKSASWVNANKATRVLI